MGGERRRGRPLGTRSSLCLSNPLRTRATSILHPPPHHLHASLVMVLFPYFPCIHSFFLPGCFSLIPFIRITLVWIVTATDRGKNKYYKQLVTPVSLSCSQTTHPPSALGGPPQQMMDVTGKVQAAAGSLGPADGLFITVGFQLSFKGPKMPQSGAV